MSDTQRLFTILRLFILCSLVFCVDAVAAAESGAIKIGFVGSLTGRSSDLGIQGRNGATLAVEEINRQGGINQKRVVLLTKDDGLNPETAMKVDRELIEEGVVAIIGHMNSTMCEAAVPVANEKRVPMISPTSSTNNLTGIDDYFLRVMNPNVRMVNFKAQYAFTHLKLRRMGTIHDLSNRSYSEGYASNFKAEFERLGGRIVAGHSFTAGSDVSHKALAGKALGQRPDGLLIVAGAIDTAMLCQHIRMTGSKIPIIISGWAQTPDLLSHGGPAVEGVLTTQYVDHDSSEEPFGAFKQKYKSRFGEAQPGFAVVMAYDAVMVVRDALTKNDDPKQLKSTIVKQRTFRGLQGPFEIDAFGDAKRRGYIVTVRNNRFAIIK